MPEDPAQLVVGEDVHGIGHAHQQLPVALSQDNGPETPCLGLGEFLHQFMVEVVMAELYEGDIQLLGKEIQQLVLFHITEIRERLAQLAPGALLLRKRRLELLVGNDAVLDEKVADADLAACFRHSLPLLRGEPLLDVLTQLWRQIR